MIVKILLQETTTMTDVDVTIGIGATTIIMRIDNVVMTKMLAHDIVVAQLRPQIGIGGHQRRPTTRSMASKLTSLGFALLDGQKGSSWFPSKNTMDKPIPESG
ncbi:hypothetical protein PR202_gb15808 [Eleusine coracana subsp. coracana]|uniref:Uncharacterized protein n=1 Tax=Eleusine coracana subsp. coracana TaxID=191504 RepID=A0AAV5EZZ7_ELECO|nr:hypothetical protein PR202_gb15808 [Eleusine coracana subsp. coracana]